MGKVAQQASEKEHPPRYVLVTLQQPFKDACVKRTGLLVGFGGREKTMIGLEIDKTLNFHESDIYAITKVEWNFGKKHRMKFFEPTENHPQLDNHMKTKAFELVKRLFGNITTRLGLEPNQYFSADKLYSNPPKHTAEEIVEPTITKVVRGTTSTAAAKSAESTFPHNNRKTTYVPPQSETTSYVTKPHKKKGPTMFRRTSTDRVKIRVAAISARLDELRAVITKEPEEDNTKGSQKEPVAPNKEQTHIDEIVQHALGNMESGFIGSATFCTDCEKRDSCNGEVDKVYYCSYKVPGKS